MYRMQRKGSLTKQAQSIDSQRYRLRSPFYILGLARLQNCVKEDFRSFTGAPAEWMLESERMPYFQSWKIDTIAESSEKIRCIQFGKADIQISFMDSLKIHEGDLGKAHRLTG